MEIKIIGSNSKEGIIYKKRVLEAVMEIDEAVTISLIDDIDIIRKYNIIKKPALVINDDITIEGRMIATKELVKLLKSKCEKKEVQIIKL